MEILLKTKWEEICNLVEEEKGGKTKYRYDCGDKPEKLGEEIRKAAQTLQAKNMGMVIFDIPVRISRNAHNPPRIDPIRVWGIDFFWPLRESPHPSEAEH